MALRERFTARRDEPLTWANAILIGTLIWVVAVVALGQLPSLIIYKFDQYVAELIELSKALPGVGEEGLSTLQIRMIRDMVANAVQIGLLVVMLVAAYIYQERKRKRSGGKGLQDPVKGYMPGK